MEILKGKLTGGFAVCASLMGLHCSVNEPTASHTSGLSVEITAAAATQPPSELVINLSNEQEFQLNHVVPSPQNNGNASFPRIPYGHLFIDITGKTQQLRTLYGHGEIDVQTPNASAGVFLRNIIEVRTLDNAQERLFMQDLGIRSAFWDAITKQSTALCTANDGQAVLRVTVAASALYLYFLCEVTDTLFFSEYRLPSGTGELTSDAVIVYLCKMPPHEMTPEKQPFPAVRFQCEIGRTNSEEGVFDLINFASDFKRNGPLVNFAADEITARILRISLSQRLLELRIRKPMLALPDGALKEIHLFGMVVRYRNSNSATLPAVLSEWQSGNVETNPRFADDSWGYLEVKP
ncbi:MAG: hypothetical protein JW913_15495 [Chitinispirillaceae bacterium]|nr:hypothetical protein [Chitinispirillaceae bacterium]